MKSLTKIIAPLLVVPLALPVLASPLYASSKRQNTLNYKAFIEKYDQNGDKKVELNEYLLRFFKEIEKDARVVREEMDIFEEYDRDMNWIVDEKDKKLNERMQR